MFLTKSSTSMFLAMFEKITKHCARDTNLIAHPYHWPTLTGSSPKLFITQVPLSPLQVQVQVSQVEVPLQVKEEGLQVQIKVFYSKCPLKWSQTNFSLKWILVCPWNFTNCLAGPEAEVGKRRPSPSRDPAAGARDQSRGPSPSKWFVCHWKWNARYLLPSFIFRSRSRSKSKTKRSPSRGESKERDAKKVGWLLFEEKFLKCRSNCFFLSVQERLQISVPVSCKGKWRFQEIQVWYSCTFTKIFEILFFRSMSKGSNSGNATPEKNGDGDENGDDWSQQKEKEIEGHFFNFHTNCP